MINSEFVSKINIYIYKYKFKPLCDTSVPSMDLPPPNSLSKHAKTPCTSFESLGEHKMMLDEYRNWLRVKNFIVKTRGRLQGRLLYELDNVLCRFLLARHNHPDLHDEIFAKAQQELATNKLRIHLNVKLLTQNVRSPANVAASVNVGDKITITCEQFSFTLSVQLFEKLSSFTSLENVTRMLMRYDSVLCTTGQFWGLPETTWSLLKDKYHVEYEGFACPLNFNLPKFFSLFLDTDAVFGSQGSFLTADLIPGVYVANPPYIENIMVPMLSQFEKLLSRSEPSTIFTLLPNWRKTKESNFDINDLFISSKYCIGSIILRKGHQLQNYVESKHMTAYFENAFIVFSNCKTKEEFDFEELESSFAG